jgi:hypothetical protein
MARSGAALGREGGPTMRTNRRASIGIIGVIAGALLLAGCSASSTPAGAASSSTPSSASQQAGSGFTAADLCALVSQAEVSAAVGNAVGAGVPSGVNAPSCTWQDSTGTGASATIAASGPDTVGQIPFGLQGIAGAHVTAASGVGDAAFFAAGATGTTAELDIKKGPRAITITVGSTDPNFTQAQQEAAELAIGTAAAENM